MFTAFYYIYYIDIEVYTWKKKHFNCSFVLLFMRKQYLFVCIVLALPYLALLYYAYVLWDEYCNKNRYIFIRNMIYLFNNNSFRMSLVTSNLYRNCTDTFKIFIGHNLFLHTLSLCILLSVCRVSTIIK